MIKCDNCGIGEVQFVGRLRLCGECSRLYSEYEKIIKRKKELENKLPVLWH